MSTDFPFIPKEEIEIAADNFRSEFWGCQHPVKPFVIWEHRQGHHLDLVPNLRDRTSVEAYVTMDFKTIVLDQGMYMQGKPMRLNFSMAHEIGHYLLHFKFLQSETFRSQQFHPATPAIWKLQLKDFDPFAYSRAETQANIFASYLLMPSANILESFDNYVEYLRPSAAVAEKFPTDEFKEYISATMADEFETSKPAMRNRLNELKVWKKVVP